MNGINFPKQANFWSNLEGASGVRCWVSKRKRPAHEAQGVRCPAGSVDPHALLLWKKCASYLGTQEIAPLDTAPLVTPSVARAKPPENVAGGEWEAEHRDLCSLTAALSLVKR